MAPAEPCLLLLRLQRLLFAAGATEDAGPNAMQVVLAVLLTAQRSGLLGQPFPALADLAEVDHRLSPELRAQLNSDAAEAHGTLDLPPG